ncbi:hypothetical protein CBS101457_006382 [Exobasidium rhododendri]|nr:hypothetical protein CBS101457_006382 [Exobasidium rhododendri]
MPRRIPTQVDQSLSRLLKGGYIKRTPVSYQTLVSYPSSSLPPRAPFADIVDGTPSSTSNVDPLPGRSNAMNSKKRAQMMPKLSPRPIVYLADRIRERFYQDHPWEALRPRTLVEGATLQEIKSPHPGATDLSAWGRNPSPEDVVACTLHLHKNHSLSLSQAYHHTLSSYHALRAEHEHASRSAVLEARSYGAVFTTNSLGEATAAVEIERGFRKEGEELLKGAAYFRKIYKAGAGAEAAVADANTGATRIKSASDRYSKGQLYLKAALEARDGVQKEVNEATEAQRAKVDAPSSSADREQAVSGKVVVLETANAETSGQKRI